MGALCWKRFLAGLTDNTAPDPAQKVAGIILAAGTGSRMGTTKQLLAFNGRPILAHAIEQGLAAGIFPLILVLGHQADKIQPRLSQFPVDITINKNFKSGMASSIATGLKRLDLFYAPRPEGAIFLLGDQPLVKAKTIRQIRDKALAGPGKIIIPTFRGQRGNPVYFDSCFFDELKQLSGDTGGRKVFQRFAHAIDELPVSSPGICMDIDTPEDYGHLCPGQRRKIEPD